MVPAAIEPDWSGDRCIVAASGPSLTAGVAEQVRFARWFDKWRVIVVNDAYRLLPYADILYAADGSWWRAHDGAPKFFGERWSSHSTDQDACDDKSELGPKYDLRLVQGRSGRGFSTDARGIHYGEVGHSGYQAVNLSLLLGAASVVLCGFDMQRKNGVSHFFGEHPEGLRRHFEFEDYGGFVRSYAPDSRILNATPDSALTCYEMVTLDEALRRDYSLHRNRAISDAGTDRGCAA